MTTRSAAPRAQLYYFWLGREAEEMHYSWRTGEDE